MSNKTSAFDAALATLRTDHTTTDGQLSYADGAYGRALETQGTSLKEATRVHGADHVICAATGFLQHEAALHHMATNPEVQRVDNRTQLCDGLTVAGVTHRSREYPGINGAPPVTVVGAHRVSVHATEYAGNVGAFAHAKTMGRDLAAQLLGKN